MKYSPAIIVYDFHVVHGSGIEAICCQCTPEVGPSLVRSQQQWSHNTPAEPPTTCFTFSLILLDLPWSDMVGCKSMQNICWGLEHSQVNYFIKKGELRKSWHFLVRRLRVITLHWCHRS